MKKAIGSLLSLVLVSASLAFAGTASAGTSAGCSGEELETLRVRMWTNQERYVMGDVARVHVKVVRQATDQAPASPAEAASVYVGLTSDDVFLGGTSITDASGKAVVKIKLVKYMPLGPVDAVAEATKNVSAGPCMRTREWGLDRQPKFFRLIRR